MRESGALPTASPHEVVKDHGRHSLFAPVLDLGRPARDGLSRNRRWTAFARFRRSVYLRSASGDIVCLCSPSIDPGPLNVRCVIPEVVDWRRLDFGADQAAEVVGESLRVGSRTVLHMGRAKIWEPSQIMGLDGSARARLESIMQGAASRAPKAGLGPIFRPTSRRLPPARSCGSDCVLNAAAPGLLALERWVEDARCRQRQRALPPPPEAAGLIGLGPGLTPSGDDYLGGLLIGLYAVGRADLAASLARLVLPEARRKTNAISYAHLDCAAIGYGSEALHRTLAAIAGSARLDVESWLHAIGRMGATSGWDALAGAVMPFRIQLETRPSARGARDRPVVRKMSARR